MSIWVSILNLDKFWPPLKQESIIYETILFILIFHVLVNIFFSYVKIRPAGMNQYETAEKQAFKCPSTKSREKVGI